MEKKIIVDGEEREERSQGEKKKNNNKFVYRITWGAIILLTLVVGYLFTAKSQSEIRITRIEGDYTEIRMQLSQIQTDIQWIKEALKEK